MTSYALAVTTVNSEEEARKLACSLVESRLAACVSIIPNITSFYNWKDRLQEDKENLLVIKTRLDLGEKLQAHFSENHPYEVPELILLRIDQGGAAYLGWMAGWLG